MSGKRFAIIGNQAYALLNFRGRLLADLAARGLEMFALAPDFTADDKRALREMGVQAVDYSLSRTGTNPLRDFGDLVGLRRTLAGLRLDGVLSITIKPAIYGTLGAWLAGVKSRYVMITGLGYAFSEDDRSLKRRLVGLVTRSLYRLALSLSHGVFLQNPDDVKQLVGMGLLPAAKVLGVYGTGVDMAEWRPAPPFLAPLTFSLVARMLRDKGVVEFVEAARRVKAAHPQVAFRLIGGLDSNPAAIGEAQLQAWVSEGLIDWVGHVPVRPWLERTSVFVLPSYREGVPRSTQEAMAMARPVITTDVPGCRETVEPGRNGFLVPARDVGALAAAMQLFIGEPGLVATMGAESRRMAEERFDATTINARIIAAMQL